MQKGGGKSKKNSTNYRDSPYTDKEANDFINELVLKRNNSPGTHPFLIGQMMIHNRFKNTISEKSLEDIDRKIPRSLFEQGVNVFFKELFIKLREIEEQNKKHEVDSLTDAFGKVKLTENEIEDMLSKLSIN